MGSTDFPENESSPEKYAVKAVVLMIAITNRRTPVIQTWNDACSFTPSKQRGTAIMPKMVVYNSLDKTSDPMG